MDDYRPLSLQSFGNDAEPLPQPTLSAIPVTPPKVESQQLLVDNSSCSSHTWDDVVNGNARCIGYEENKKQLKEEVQILSQYNLEHQANDEEINMNDSLTVQDLDAHYDELNADNEDGLVQDLGGHNNELTLPYVGSEEEDTIDSLLNQILLLGDDKLSELLREKNEDVDCIPPFSGQGSLNVSPQGANNNMTGLGTLTVQENKIQDDSNKERSDNHSSQQFVGDMCATTCDWKDTSIENRDGSEESFAATNPTSEDKAMVVTSELEIANYDHNVSGRDVNPNCLPDEIKGNTDEEEGLINIKFGDFSKYTSALNRGKGAISDALFGGKSIAKGNKNKNKCNDSGTTLVNSVCACNSVQDIGNVKATDEFNTTEGEADLLTPENYEPLQKPILKFKSIDESAVDKTEGSCRSPLGIQQNNEKAFENNLPCGFDVAQDANPNARKLSKDPYARTPVAKSEKEIANENGEKDTWMKILKYTALPVAGAVAGTIIGGPFGFAAGLKLGSLMAVGGGVGGFLGAKIEEEEERNEQEAICNSIKEKEPLLKLPAVDEKTESLGASPNLRESPGDSVCTIDKSPRFNECSSDTQTTDDVTVENDDDDKSDASHSNCSSRGSATPVTEDELHHDTSFDEQIVSSNNIYDKEHSVNQYDQEDLLVIESEINCPENLTINIEQQENLDIIKQTDRPDDEADYDQVMRCNASPSENETTLENDGELQYSTEPNFQAIQNHSITPKDDNGAISDEIIRSSMKMRVLQELGMYSELSAQAGKENVDTAISVSAKKTTTDVARDTAKDNTNRAVKDVAKDPTHNTTKDAAKEVATDTATATTTDVANEFSSGGSWTYKTAFYPVVGAALGALTAGPLGVAIGLKAGSMAAVGGTLIGYTSGVVMGEKSIDKENEKRKNDALRSGDDAKSANKHEQQIYSLVKTEESTSTETNKGTNISSEKAKNEIAVPPEKINKKPRLKRQDIVSDMKSFFHSSFYYFINEPSETSDDKFVKPVEDDKQKTTSSKSAGHQQTPNKKPTVVKQKNEKCDLPAIATSSNMTSSAKYKNLDMDNASNSVNVKAERRDNVSHTPIDGNADKADFDQNITLKTAKGVDEDDTSHGIGKKEKTSTNKEDIENNGNELHETCLVGGSDLTLGLNEKDLKDHGALDSHNNISVVSNEINDATSPCGKDNVEFRAKPPESVDIEETSFMSSPAYLYHNQRISVGTSIEREYHSMPVSQSEDRRAYFGLREDAPDMARSYHESMQDNALNEAMELNLQLDEKWDVSMQKSFSIDRSCQTEEANARPQRQLLRQRNEHRNEQRIEPEALNQQNRWTTRLKYSALPIAGAVAGTIIGGPFGLAAGFKLGSIMAVGGGIGGFLGAKIVEEERAENGDIQPRNQAPETSVKQLL